MKLRIKQDYVLCEFYKFGEDDTFDYFYYRNHDLFIKNNFYKNYNWNIGYRNDVYSNELKELSNANIIKNDKFILPKGVYDLKEINETWELNINNIIVSNLKNLLDEKLWSYNPKVTNYIELIV